jgi:hypothetical protein
MNGVRYFNVAGRLGLAFVTAASIAGCGYPVDPDKWLPDFGIHGNYGAIALNATDSIGALTARFLSQGEADNRALQLCGNGCAIALRFEGAGVCGAVASGANGSVGVGSGAPQSSADAVALEQCRQDGATDCVVALQGCND